MSDLAAERREARRRRIMENASSRLDRINRLNIKIHPEKEKEPVEQQGYRSEETVVAAAKQSIATAVARSIINQSSREERDTLRQLINDDTERFPINNDPQLVPELMRTCEAADFEAADFEAADCDGDGHADGERNVAQENRTRRDEQRLRHVLLLGILVRLYNFVLACGGRWLDVDLDDWQLRMIFVPFCAYEVANYFVLTPMDVGEEPPSTLLRLLLALGNVRSKWVLRAFAALSRGLVVLKDVSLFIFGFMFVEICATLVLGNELAPMAANDV